MHSRLNKPTELRNHVYSFAVTVSQDAIKFKSRARPLPLYMRRTDPKWKHQKRCFLGLTRVCKEIRKEFLPLHLADHTIELAGKDLDRYLALVVSRIDGPPSRAVGNLIVILLPLDPNDFLSDPEPAVSLLPLLELCTTAPHFKARFCKSSTYADEPPEIIRLAWTATWRQLVDIQLNALTYDMAGFDTLHADILIMVKLHCRDQWHKGHLNFLVVDDLEKDMETWASAMGLDLNHEEPLAEVRLGFAVC